MLIDHIGIAVHDMESAIKLYENALQKKCDHREVVAAANLEIAFFDLAESSIELLSPTKNAESGVIYKFLQEHGEGLHHLAFKTKDINTSLEHFKSLGHQLIDEQPRASVRNTLIAFIHPKTFSGTLIELVQHQ